MLCFLIRYIRRTYEYLYFEGWRNCELRTRRVWRWTKRAMTWRPIWWAWVRSLTQKPLRSAQHLRNDRKSRTSFRSCATGMRRRPPSTPKRRCAISYGSNSSSCFCSLMLRSNISLEMLIKWWFKKYLSTDFNASQALLSEFCHVNCFIIKCMIIVMINYDDDLAAVLVPVQYM